MCVCHLLQCFGCTVSFRLCLPQIVCFANLQRSDEKTLRFQQMADVWHDIASLNTAQVCRLAVQVRFGPAYPAWDVVRQCTVPFRATRSDLDLCVAEVAHRPRGVGLPISQCLPPAGLAVLVWHLLQQQPKAS